MAGEAKEQQGEEDYMESEQDVESTQINRGRLKNGNPSGDPSTSPRCGARTRSGKPCRAPAMWSATAGRYTRCRIHGGSSTGPRTPEGMEKCRRANWKTGKNSGEAIAFRRDVRRERQFLAKVSKFLLDLAKRGAYPSPDSASIADQVGLEHYRFTLAATERRREDLAAPVRNLVGLAERLGFKVTQGVDDALVVRRLDRAEMMAVVEECLRFVPREVADQLRARVLRAKHGSAVNADGSVRGNAQSPECER